MDDDYDGNDCDDNDDDDIITICGVDWERFLKNALFYSHLLLHVHISLRFSLDLPPPSRSFSSYTKIIIDNN